MAIIKKPILIYSRGDTATLERLSKIRAEMRTIPIRGDAKFIFRVAINAERWCEERGLRVMDRFGIEVVNVSNRKSIPLLIKLVRKTKGWYLVEISHGDIWTCQEEGSIYYLNPAQDDKVKSWLSEQYIVRDDGVD